MYFIDNENPIFVFSIATLVKVSEEACRYYHVTSWTHESIVPDSKEVPNIWLVYTL